MSQAKVEQYKKDKLNRKKNNKKAKNRFRIEIAVFFLAIAVCVGVFVVGFINNQAASATVEPIMIDGTAIDDYVNSIPTETVSTEDTEDEAGTEEETGEE